MDGFGQLQNRSSSTSRPVCTFRIGGRTRPLSSGVERKSTSTPQSPTATDDSPQSLKILIPDEHNKPLKPEACLQSIIASHPHLQASLAPILEILAQSKTSPTSSSGQISPQRPPSALASPNGQIEHLKELVQQLKFDLEGEKEETAYLRDTLKGEEEQSKMYQEIHQGDSEHIEGLNDFIQEKNDEIGELKTRNQSLRRQKATLVTQRDKAREEKAELRGELRAERRENRGLRRENTRKTIAINHLVHIVQALSQQNATLRREIED